MSFAFLNAANEVIGVSAVDRSLVDAQIKLPAATQRIAGAPDELVAKGTNGQFHKLTSGDGTQIGDYTLADYIEHQKAGRFAAIDARTFELTTTTPIAHDGHQFVMHQANMVLLFSMTAVKDVLLPSPYPMTFPALGASYSIGNVAELDAFSLAVRTATEIHVMSGEALKTAINAATNQAELDAVVDNR